MKASFLTAIGAVAVIAGSSASAQIVSNGSFESFTGTLTSHGSYLYAASTTLTDWTIIVGVSDPEIALLENGNSFSLTASEGKNFLDLTGYVNSGFPKGVSQTLTGLTPGQTYTFSMDLGIRNGACDGSLNNCSGPVSASVVIGATSHTFTENSDTAGNVWGTFGFNFEADSSQMTLQILGETLPQGNIYIGLDNVSVVQTTVPIPEPSTYALMLAGLGALGFVARRRRT